MDLTAAYCPIRRDLEELAWALTSRLSNTTNRLLGLIGEDHAKFLAARSDCHSTRYELTGVHKRLVSHRRIHHC